MGPEVRAHLRPVLFGDLFQAEMVVSQHAREGCGRRCAILSASELVVVFGRHSRALYRAVTYSVMRRLRTAGILDFTWRLLPFSSRGQLLVR